MHHTVSRTTGGKNRLISSDRNYFFFVEFCCVLSGYLSTKWSDQRREGRGRGVNCLFFSNFFLDKSDKWMGEIMFRKNRKLLKRERERESKSNCIGGYARPMAAAVDTLTITVQHTPQFRPESFNPSTTFRKDQLPEMPVVRTSERSGGLFRVFFSLFDFFFYTKKKRGGSSAYANERTIFIFFLSICKFLFFLI